MLSRKTKYGVKALTYIARCPEKTTVTIQEIADAENISKKFLESILLSMRKAGFLGSKKGKGGGYYLIKSPSDIRMATVIRTLEGPIALLPCVSLNFYERCEDCLTEEECSIHSLMIEVRDASLEVLENKYLSDLITQSRDASL